MDIERIKGPDRVRRRPAVVFGSDGSRGATEAVKMLLEIFFTEAALGFCKNISLSIRKDNSVTIKCIGRSFLLDETIIDDKPAWYQDFCELYPAPGECDKNYYLGLGAAHNKLFGDADDSSPVFELSDDPRFSLCCVQYASRYMRVESVKNSVRKCLDFEKGICVSELNKEKVQEEDSTTISFLLDDEVFRTIVLPEFELSLTLYYASLAIPGLKCEYSDARKELNLSYFYPEGVKGLIEENEHRITPVFFKEIEATGRDRYDSREYTAKIRVYLAFADECGFSACLHNYRNLIRGGKHSEFVKESVVSELNFFCYELLDIYQNESFPDTFEEIANNVLLYVETVCPDYAVEFHSFSNRDDIRNPMICDMAMDLINIYSFGVFLRENEDKLKPMLERLKVRTLINRIDKK